ncbi:hypothetical protein EIN_251030 [Entamoeba invadens IP1]|uniref:DUF1963 domain-containing protein n=1 Tax=Entamoeba invadens IP1 TaxID=370355 RepID=A0A0A1UGJ3_ENTIV|nr:hypothetical protein EIN_251030 [Entamoeba invadens IP1]ELP94959.1 hypothetical protein EIN_251030 [Entamoeba invadens IP1]|eukprot:XP_004261730.1 hypothetical protein EIN_251030 [Entamoeba invadens IP1]
MNTIIVTDKCDTFENTILTDEVTKSIMGELFEKYKKECIVLDLKVDNTITPINSCVGGIPYYPKGSVYPYIDGHPLVLLCQINFSEMPKLVNFPTSGMLQFFVDPEDQYDTSRFKVLYTKEVSIANHQPLPDDAKIAMENKNKEVPYFGVFRVHGKLGETVAIPLNERENIVKKLAIKYSASTSAIEFQIDTTQAFFKAVSNYGGCPHYIQMEESFRDDIGNKDTLLLQLASEEYSENEEKYPDGNDTNKMEWCDNGVGLFFINHDNLKNLDFSDIFYGIDTD